MSIIDPLKIVRIAYYFWIELNSHISWSQRSSPWSHKCSGAQRKTAQINIVHTTTKNTLRLNTYMRISIRLQHHVHSCPFPVQLKITTEISRYIQRSTHNRGNKPGVLSEWRPASNVRNSRKQRAKKAKIAPRITQQLPCLSWFIYSSSSISNKYVVVMILQTQSRSSSEKGYIADTRPRNFDASISAASPCKTNNNAQQQWKPYLYRFRKNDNCEAWWWCTSSSPCTCGHCAPLWGISGQFTQWCGTLISGSFVVDFVQIHFFSRVYIYIINIYF